MNKLRKITIEELREIEVVVYTQEEVDLFNKLGVFAIITYVNGGICINSGVQPADDTIVAPLTKLRSLISSSELL